MEVKPVGRERDVQIWNLKFPQKIFLIKEITEYLDEWVVPHYSTSLTDAWELWEEMKKSIFTMQLIGTRNKRTQVAIGDHWNGKRDTPITFKAWLGQDEPDAISGAWVMWKAGEK